MRNLYILLILITVSFSFCNNPDPDFGFKRTYPPSEGADAKAIIEIPAGTLDKYELNKRNMDIDLEHVNGVPRVIQYLSYPGNYGFIPNTLLSKKNGGDGDPLDVLVLGASVERGDQLDVKIIGVLKLLDKGEQDDKLIAVSADSPFWNLNSLEELNANFPGSMLIIETWFSNYKGAGKMKSQGFLDREEALKILESAKISS